MLKKFTILFLSAFIFFNSYIRTDGNNYIQVSNNDEDSFKIENLIPKRGEQNIISTPEIKISYSSLNTLHKFKLYLNYKDITNKAISTSRYIYYKCDKKLKPGIQVVRLEVSVEPNNNEVTEWYFTVGSPLYNNYRGVFFNNTNELNMLTSHENLNTLCKDTSNLDYIFLTENFTSNDKKYRDASIDSKRWKKLIDCCDKHSINGEFISIPGFELSPRLKNEISDTKVNVYNSSNPFTFKDNIALSSFYKNLYYNENDVICLFRDNTNFNNINFFKYSPYGDDVISLIELKKEFSQEENKEKLIIDNYKEALDNGWHLSPIVCDYNENTYTDTINTPTTTILSEDLSKSEILHAIKDRRIYVSEDKNIDVFFSINKMPMGSIISNPSYIRIIVSAVDNDAEDKINKIEIFSNNNELVYKKDFNSNYGKVDFTLKPPSKNSYYFALITENNNNVSVTSPIWIEK